MTYQIPEGWKLVPIEPTEKMMDCYRAAFISEKRFDGKEVYKAMLEAAPVPPAHIPEAEKMVEQDDIARDMDDSDMRRGAK